MTSRENTRRILRHDAPSRLGWDFIDSRYQDILHADIVRLVPYASGRYADWGRHEELSRVSGFVGETRYDPFGNIYGRFEGKTKGECVYGALQDDWEGLDAFSMPPIDLAHAEKMEKLGLAACDRYVLASLPSAVFSVLRDVRKMDNALMDTVLEPEAVEAFLEKVAAMGREGIALCKRCGVDGVIVYDDWGTQNAPFISPASFAALFKPVYATLADAAHDADIDFLLHSCGKVRPLVDDMIEAGIDAFQFDQPELSGSRFWAETYGDRICLYSPVDIQTVLPTGDRAYIEATAKAMADAFRAAGGSLIAKDYGGLSSLADINVKPEWAQWATDVFVANSWR